MDINKSMVLIGVQTLDYDREFTQLLGQDYYLLFAKNCQEVIEIAWETQPDLILLEGELITSCSVNVCSLLGDDPRTRVIPVIIFLNSKDKPQIEKFYRCVTDYLTFPDHPEILKAHLSTFLELKYYRDIFERKRTTGSLAETPVWTTFKEYLEWEWRRAIRYQTPESLIIVGVDFIDSFKEYYGPPSRDDCLRQVSNLLKENAKRGTDYMARYENDIFVLLMPDTDMGGALKVAQRIQEGMEVLDIPHPSSPVADRVTLSIGVATMLPTENQKSSELIQRAMEFLREAENNGYNQIRYILTE